MMMMIHVDNVDDAQHNILFCIIKYALLPYLLLRKNTTTFFIIAYVLLIFIFGLEFSNLV